MIDQLLEMLPTIVTALVVAIAVFVTSLWLGMVLWTFRDIRARTRDVLVQIMATLMVALLTSRPSRSRKSVLPAAPKCGRSSSIARIATRS